MAMSPSVQGEIGTSPKSNFELKYFYLRPILETSQPIKKHEKTSLATYTNLTMRMTTAIFYYPGNMRCQKKEVFSYDV